MNKTVLRILVVLTFVYALSACSDLSGDGTQVTLDALLIAKHSKKESCFSIYKNYEEHWKWAGEYCVNYVGAPKK